MTLRGTLPADVTRTQPKVGFRTLLVAALAGLSTFDPTYTLAVGPTVAVIVFLLGRPLALKVDAPVVLAALFVLWTWVSMLWTPVEDFTRATALLWTNLLVMFVAVYDVIKSRAQLRTVAVGFVVGGVFTVVKNLYFGPDVAETAVTTGRAILGNANVNYVAYALTTALALVLVLWGTRTNTKSSILLLGAATAVLVPGLIATDTRAAQLGALFLGIWALICVFAKRQPIRWLIAIVLMASFCLVTGVLDQASLVFESGARVTGDWSGRLVIWPMAREIWAENPVVGVGAGAFIVTNELGVAAHNFILQTGTGLGIIGVGLLLALIWTALSGKASRRTPLHLWLLGAFIAASAPLFLTGVWETAPAAWFAIAVIARLQTAELNVVSVDVEDGDTGDQSRKKLPGWASKAAAVRVDRVAR